MESTTQSPKPFRNYAGLIAAGVDNVVGLTGTRSFQTTCSLYQKKFLAATFCAGEATSPKMEFTPTPTLFQLQDEPSIYGHFQCGKWRQVTINPWIWRYGIPLLFTLKQHFWLFIPPKKYWKRIKPLRNSRKSHSCWWNPSKKNPEKTCLAVTCYPLPILPIEIAAL